MEDKAEKLLARYERAKKKRTQWEHVFDECYELAIPHRATFSNQTPGDRRDDRIFDQTAVVGVQEFTSRLQHGVVPSYSKFADLEAGGEVPPAEAKEFNGQLEEVTDYVFEVIQNSNFPQQVHESFYDLSIGTGVLKVDEGDSIKPIICRACPLPSVVLDEGPDGLIDYKAFCRRDVQYSELETIYRNVKLTDQMREKAKNPENKTNVIEVCYRDWSVRNEIVTKTCAIAVDDKHLLWEQEERGIGSAPILAYRWDTNPGEVYGRGPLLQALSGIKTANEIVELVLQNAHMSIAGVYQMEDDGIINPETINFVPGTVIPVGPGSQGLRPVGSAGSFDVSELMLGQLRMDIKRALFNDMLGDPDKTPATATEVAERMADLSRRMGSSFSKLQAELVEPFLQRVVYILKKKGLIELPAINGREIKVKAVSPLAQAQANEDIASVARFLEMGGQFFGPEALLMEIDPRKTMAFLREKFGAPESLLRDEASRRQFMSLMQQGLAAQNGQGPEAPAQGQPTLPQ